LATDSIEQKEAKQHWQAQQEQAELKDEERRSSQWMDSEHQKERHIEQNIEADIAHQVLKKETCKPVAVMPIFFAGVLCGVVMTGVVSSILPIIQPKKRNSSVSM
jgi:hypothetical protein